MKFNNVFLFFITIVCISWYYEFKMIIGSCDDLNQVW